MKTHKNWLSVAFATLFVMAFSPADAQGPPGGPSKTPANPVAVPIEVSGALYGTVVNGGTSGYGAVWKYDEASGTFSIICSFDGSHGAFPYGKLLYASDGYLYGTTTGGGAYARFPPGQPVPGGAGGVFRVSPSGVGFTFYPIPNSSNVSSPNMGLTEDPVGATGGNRVFYGTAGGGANSTGVIYEFVPGSGGTGTFTSLYSFPSTTAGSGSTVYNSVGASPRCELVLQTTSNARYLFGTAMQGGPDGCGSVYSYSWSNTSSVAPASTGTIILVHSFNATGNEFEYPGSGLTQTSTPSGTAPGTMWGTVQTGTGTQSNLGGLYSITNGLYNEWPCASGTYAGNGTQSGVVGMTLLQPYATVLLGSDGYLYATSLYAGHTATTPTPPYNPYPMHTGSIFRFSPDTGSYLRVWSFTPDLTPALSEYPWSGLIEASDGYVYGVNAGFQPTGGSASDNGALYRFQLGTLGQVTLVHQF